MKRIFGFIPNAETIKKRKNKKNPKFFTPLQKVSLYVKASDNVKTSKFCYL
jgi:hypothetical protein